MTLAAACDPASDLGEWPALPEGFTRCDVAQVANTSLTLAVVTVSIVVFLLAIMAFRSR